MLVKCFIDMHIIASSSWPASKLHSLGSPPNSGPHTVQGLTNLRHTTTLTPHLSLSTLASRAKRHVQRWRH
jgi:hypothetical protein